MIKIHKSKWNQNKTKKAIWFAVKINLSEDKYMELDINKMADDCIKAISDKIHNLNTLNIIVAGKTGVGKSTLINGIFRENLAETGIGRPVTTHMRKISKSDLPVSIYDTRGFELGKDAQSEVKKEIFETIKKGYASKNINESIHCIWYCINTASNRVEDEEIEWLKSLTVENQITQVPIIIILTQSFSKKSKDEMKQYLLNQNLEVAQIIPVLAQDYEIDDDYVINSYGLDTIIKVMSEVLPDELQDTLQNVQKASLDEKIKHSHQVVAATVTATFAEGFSPLPFSDAALLIPTQVGMVASITALFGIDLNKSIITAFVSSALGSGGLTIAGKTIAANLLKLVPGAGTLIGGVISGTTAGLLTTALGEAYIQLMIAVYKGEISSSDIGTDVGKAKLKSIFKKELKSTKK